jgi:histidinol-phosphate aminotransferase
MEWLEVVMDRQIEDRGEKESGTVTRAGTPRSVQFLETLSPYKPVSSLTRIWDHPSQVPFKLDWNEASVPPSPRVYSAIVEFLSFSNHLNWYPELGSISLCSALAERNNLSCDNVLVTNGSDDALELVCKAYLEPGDRVLVPMPTYTHFLVYVQARGAEVVSFLSEDLFDPDITRLSRAITPDTKLVYLVSPNNPTGVTYEAADVAGLLEEHPETLFIVDEAYFEFHGRSVMELVRSSRNLVVTRTFSKCYGIAGLRIGYLCTNEEIMNELKKIFNPKSVNRVGQIAAMACLSDGDYYGEYVSQVTRAKVFLKEELAKRGIPVVITPANYILLEVDQPVEFCRRLEEQGVYIRDRSTLPRMERYVRMSVPTLSQAAEVLARIDRVWTRE